MYKNNSPSSLLNNKPHSPSLLWRNAFQIKHLIFISLLFISLAFIGYLSTFALLKLELDSAIESELEIFWNNEYQPFISEKSKTTATQKGNHTYWLILNDFNKSSYLRVDPAKNKTSLKIHSTKLYSLQHLPIDINFFNHAMSIKNIEERIPATALTSFAEFESLNDDPQIKIQPIHSNSPLASLLFLTIAIIALFSKKDYRQALLLLSAGIFFYYCFSFNQTTVSFHVQADQAGLAKVFWRDEAESYSNTKAKTIPIKKGSHNYHIATRNISNIEVLHVEAAGKKESFIIDDVKIQATGFKEFSFEGTESIIQKKTSSTELFFSITLFLIVYTLIFWGLFYSPKNKKTFHSHFFQKVIRVLFLFSSYLVINLAWQADLNIHPDENAHIPSVEYFSQYSDFPTIGDSRSLDTYQKPWAVSRLDDLGISYYIAGKFSHVAQLFFTDKAFLARAFNTFLFMLFFVLSRNKRLLLFFTPLVCTPQVWYLYSYANRGGFVLFISLLLAWQLANKKSSFNLFLHGDRIFSHWKKVLFPALLLGIISIEQTNYLLFILFVFSILLWELLFFIKNKKIFLYKCLLFMMMGASVYAVRYSLDVSINGSNKSEQRTAYAEEHAEKKFKPSVAKTQDSHPGFRLKDKGVSFTEIFGSKWSWHKLSFKSFVGLYGYQARYSPKWYYAYVSLIYAVIFLTIFRNAVFQSNWRYKIFSFISLTAMCGGLLMSMLFCWLYDFQPQGRYIFPIIPIMLIYFWKVFPQWNRHEKAILQTSVVLLALLSVYSFNEVALNYLFSEPVHF